MKSSRIIAIITLLLSIGSISNADDPWINFDQGSNIWDANDVNNSIHCVIKDITLMSKSEIDCKKAGGTILPASKK
jgi:hypothetical protein